MYLGHEASVLQLMSSHFATAVLFHDWSSSLLASGHLALADDPLVFLGGATVPRTNPGCALCNGELEGGEGLSL